MDKANWSPEEAVQLAKELNNWGTHYRNAVACLYNTFSLELSNYWRGKNYNVVAEYVNEHYDEFDHITNSMCITIPSAIQSIASMQAEDGLGSVSVFNYEINDSSGVDSAIGFNLIPMTEETADGSIVLTQDVVTKYIDGSGEPSLIFYQEKMEEYMNSYSNVLDQFSSIKEFNDALKSAYEAIASFKLYSNNAVKNIIEETKIRADAELGKISETDASTKDLAVTTLTGTTSTTSKNNLSTNPNTGFSKNANTNFSSSNAKSKSSKDTSSSSSNAKSESSRYTSSSSDNKKYKDSENPNSKPGFIGPVLTDENKQLLQKQANQQVVEKYLNSDYEKGPNDEHIYTINDKEMFIDDITDNGDSYTITYYDKEKFDNDPNGYTEPDTIDIDK